MADWPRGGAGTPDAGEWSRRSGNTSVHTGRSACLRVSGESRAVARGESGGERSRVAEAPTCA